MAKIRHNNIVDTINDIATQASERGITHLTFSGEEWTGRYLSIDGRQMLNFGTCGYLGLESHTKVIQSAIDYTQRYGTQYSISRVYATSSTNLELEERLSRIFDGHGTLVFSSTSLAHISVMPIAIGPNDAIIMDQQAHVSMQTAAQLLAAKGVPIELVRHSNLEMVERKIKALRDKHDKIWYVMDGVYSMYGDITPAEQLNELAKTYPSLHYYVDDAHGMSWCGKNGCGAVFETLRKNEKSILATTMAKGFGSIGGCIVFPNEDIYMRVKLHGGPFTYSHPIVPSVVGASMAIADIHLSGELETIQDSLQEKIQYCNQLLDESEIPVLSDPKTPIYFLGTGQPAVGYNFNKRILDDGFYVNIGLFPAVPVKNTGLRFTINNHLTKEDIYAFVESLKYHFPRALDEEGRTLNDVRKAFKLPLIEEEDKISQEADSHEIFVHDSIKEIDQNQWNKIFKGKGNYDWDALNLLERSFSGNKKREENWDFRYLIIRDQSGNIKLATFLTTGLFKDDLLAPISVSIEIETERLKDPYHLTSKTLTLGSVFSEGDHLYVDKEYGNWKKLVKLMLKEIFKIQEEEGINAVILRDFDPEDEIYEICNEGGFFKIDMPSSNVINNLKESIDLHYEGLKRKHRKHIRDDIFSYLPEIDVEVKESVSDAELSEIYRLYENVANVNYAMNIFKYPRKLLSEMNTDADWEFVNLYHNGKLVAAGCCHKSGSNYCALLLGMDYEANKKLKVYKQILYQVVKRSIGLGMKSIRLGLSADLEKRKVGATAHPKVAFISMTDIFNLEKIESMPVVNKRG